MVHAVKSYRMCTSTVARITSVHCSWLLSQGNYFFALLSEILQLTDFVNFALLRWIFRRFVYHFIGKRSVQDLFLRKSFLLPVACNLPHCVHEKRPHFATQCKQKAIHVDYTQCSVKIPVAFCINTFAYRPTSHPAG